MRRRPRHQDPSALPWIQRGDPMVPEPTATGWTVWRLWIDEQLTAASSARRRFWRPRRRL